MKAENFTNMHFKVLKSDKEAFRKKCDDDGITMSSTISSLIKMHNADLLYWENGNPVKMGVDKKNSTVML